MIVWGSALAEQNPCLGLIPNPIFTVGSVRLSFPEPDSWFPGREAEG